MWSPERTQGRGFSESNQSTWSGSFAPLARAGRKGRESHTIAVSIPSMAVIRDPSGLNEAEVTLPVCPLSVRTSAPVRASHSLTVPSPLAVSESRAVRAERRRVDLHVCAP